MIPKMEKVIIQNSIAVCDIRISENTHIAQIVTNDLLKLQICRRGCYELPKIKETV